MSPTTLLKSWADWKILAAAKRVPSRQTHKASDNGLWSPFFRLSWLGIGDNFKFSIYFSLYVPQTIFHLFLVFWGICQWTWIPHCQLVLYVSSQSHYATQGNALMLQGHMNLFSSGLGDAHQNVRYANLNTDLPVCLLTASIQMSCAS